MEKKTEQCERSLEPGEEVIFYRGGGYSSLKFFIPKIFPDYIPAVKGVTFMLFDGLCRIRHKICLKLQCCCDLVSLLGNLTASASAVNYRHV